ncbi:hypothetical protein EST38_g9067 [Candolleomyces aberdarensis]|uniref:Uncharacterized protein n=1 Tax=Candolleomyces aberdarensis TaxID=2316362 RepID=A0A4Q2DAV6_9AGAR|nr:hypothetical protein EST38_g9067 [Candolleomyces aberdarensis]
MEILEYPYLYRGPDPQAPGQHGIPSAILQKRTEDDIRYKMIVRDNGYLYRIHGKSYFSPNCNRPHVRPPPPLLSPNDGILQGRDYQMVEFCRPQWWTKAHRYLAFTPLYPEYSTPPLHPLLHLPRVTYDTLCKTPVPEHKIWLEWQRLQSQIAQAIHVLLFASGAAAVRPAYPCARVDAKVNLGKGVTKEEVKKDVFGAFSWFSIWLGCLSYAIAVSQAVFLEAKAGGVCRMPGWVEILLKGIHQVHTADGDVVLDEIFISDLQNTCVSRLDESVERVGTFVTIPDNDQEDAVSIDWLCEVGVPVWYEWGSREEEIASRNPFWRRYAPPPDALVVCSVGCGDGSSTPPINRGSDEEALQLPAPDIPPQVSYSSGSRNMRRPEPAPHQRTWDVHFEERAVRRIAMLAHETQEEKVRRLNRERKPPTDPRKTQYYIWEWDLTRNIFVRRRVEKDDLDDIFMEDGRFGKQQAKYNSVFNEWDLCEYFGPPDNEQLEYMAETWAEYEGIPVEEELSRCRAYYGLPALAQATEISSPDPEFNQIDPPSHSHEDDTLSSFDASCVQLTPSAQTEIPFMAYKSFGYIYPLPSPADSKHEPGLSQDSSPTTTSLGLVPRVLGISQSVPRNDPFWKSPGGQGVLEFMKSLAKGALSNETWDLSLSSRMPVVLLPRFKLLRWVTVSLVTQIDKWDNVDGQWSFLAQTMQEVYWFVGDHGQPWSVGCISPEVALLICRLDQTLLDPLAIAHVLLGQGIRFQTWKLVPTLPETLLRFTPRLLKYRRHNYQYTKNDYESYLLTCGEWAVATRGIFRGLSRLPLPTQCNNH